MIQTPSHASSDALALIVAAAAKEDAGRSILGGQFERVGKITEAAPPVAPLISIDTGPVGVDHHGELGKACRSVMPERFIDPGRLRQFLSPVPKCLISW
jgi:hypothetical protein